MSDKVTLPRRIEMRDAIYNLVYIPGNDNYLEPNFAVMQPAAADSTLVKFGNEQKWMSWVLMDAPARIGSATPAKRFLLFRLYDQPIQPNPAMFNDMIVYLVSPIDQGSSPAQQFLNALIGKREEEVSQSAPRDDWAQKLFNITPPDDESETAENPQRQAHSDTNHTKSESISVEVVNE